MRRPAAPAFALLSLAFLLLAGCAAPQGPRATATAGSDAGDALTGGTTQATAGTGDPWGRQECPDHWHATFRVYTPAADGSPRMLDMNLPRDAYGRPYYDLGTGKMRLAVHMHQSGPEQGSEALGPAQLHYEAGGVCVDVQDSLAVADIGLTATSLRVTGQHRQGNATGLWNDGAGGELRVWIQDAEGAWAEREAADVLGRQLQDGEALLVAFGDYTPAQVQEMQDSVPAPMSRPAATSFFEGWETLRPGWTATGPGASRDCDEGRTGDCSLLLLPPCCDAHTVHRWDFAQPVARPFLVEFSFMGGGTTGDTDTELVLDLDGTDLVYSLTRGVHSPNNGLSLDNGQPRHNPCGEWPAAGSWVGVEVEVHRDVAYAAAHDARGRLLGSCEYPVAGGDLAAVALQGVDWSGEGSAAYRFDDLRITALAVPA